MHLLEPSIYPMSNREESTLSPKDLVAMAVKHRWLLLAPALLGALVAAASTQVLKRDYSADQGLIIRSDAAGYSEQRLGKFTDLSEMKTVQETLLELARSKSVVSAVLQDVGIIQAGSAPSADQLDEFRDKLRFTPPGGAEFGKTEVFYLGMLDPDPVMAIAKVESLTQQLDKRLQALRNRRAESMVAEVERSVAIAQEQLKTHNEALSKFEKSVGSDLIELRHLISPNGGQSELGQRIGSLENELRGTETERLRNEALLKELNVALQSPENLLATPDSLLASQPGLARLKNGLVDAQLSVARLSGNRTDDHPMVQGARKTQDRVHQELSRELPVTIAGVELEINVSQQQEASLQRKITTLRERSANLASRRSEYARLTSNVEGQTRVLEGAQQQLSDAESHLAGAASASLLAKIDEAEVSNYPLGPSRSSVTAAGGLAGLILGGCLVLTLGKPPQPPSRKQSFGYEEMPRDAQDDSFANDWEDFGKQQDSIMASL